MVVLMDIVVGSVVMIDNDLVIFGQDIVCGYKFVLCVIVKGENVVKYGLLIGYVLVDIVLGEYVYVYNMCINFSDFDVYCY